MARAPFTIDRRLTGIAIAYSNRQLIADNVLPRVGVGQTEFKWLQFPFSEQVTIPNTIVGRKSMPNEIELTATETSSFTLDYGLDDVIPADDVTNAPEGYDPMGHATETLANLIALDRERRVANLVTNLNTYAAANRTTLSGTSQWSDFTNSNPVTTILDALSTPLMRPNTMVINERAFNFLRTHPRVVSAVLGNSGVNGIVTRQQIAQLFELDDVLVGQSFVNGAQFGQTATLNRVWGNHCALLHLNRLANNRRGVTFGYTAQYGSRVAARFEEDKVGLRGATRIRVGESVREIIAAADAAYFFQNAVA